MAHDPGADLDKILAQRRDLTNARMLGVRLLTKPHQRLPMIAGAAKL
jgi:hypothetical protein